MRRTALFCAAFLFFFTDCALEHTASGQAASSQTSPPKVPQYTPKEYSGMLTCVGITDTAWTNAVQKLKGVSIDDAKKHYDGLEATAKARGLDPNYKTLVLRTIDKVYSEPFTNSWDYAVSFFSECAENVANIPRDRSSFGGYCMQRAMIGTTAADFRQSGQPAEKVYEQFAKFASSTSKTIIDRVYAESKNRADAGLDEWKACMAPLVSTSPSSSQPPAAAAAASYTEKEASALWTCEQATQQVMYASQWKLGGVSLQDAKKKYDVYPDGAAKTFALNIVDRVYADSFANAWVYTTTFFSQCAQKSAAVQLDRQQSANGCLRNALIGMTAKAAKDSHQPAEKVYAAFAGINFDKAKAVIDSVYADANPSADVGGAQWKACIAPLVSTSASSPQPPAAAAAASYTEKEASALWTCEQATQYASSAAEWKLFGRSLQDSKKVYDALPEGPFKTFVLSTFDKVYADSFTDSWRYTLSFFSQCATEKAVPPDRQQFALDCMRDALIGTAARSSKDAHLPADKAYARFSSLNYDKAKAIIDGVYADANPPADVGGAQWKACIAPAVTHAAQLGTEPPWSELLVAKLPPSYKVVQEARSGTPLAKVMIPESEIGKPATERLTTQLFPGLKGRTPEQFQGVIKQLWSKCQGFSVLSENKGNENGYPSLLWLQSCPLNPATGKPEYAWYKAIAGHDNFYLINKTFSFAPSEEQNKLWTDYFKSVTVCDSRLSGRPCANAEPDGSPHANPAATNPPSSASSQTGRINSFTLSPSGKITPFALFPDGRVQGLPISEHADIVAPYFVGSPQEQKKIVATFVADNSKADSVALYVAASTAMRISDVKDAAFLLYAAQIRKHFDYKRFGLSETNPRDIQFYWDFLNEPVSQEVSPAITRRPVEFSEAVEMIAKWPVVPAADASYEKKLYGESVLPKDQWQALGEAEKKDFMDNYARKEKAFLSDPQNVEALIFVQDYNFGKIPHTPENDKKYAKYRVIRDKQVESITGFPGAGKP